MNRHAAAPRRKVSVFRWGLLLVVVAGAIFGLTRIQVAPRDPVTPAALDAPLPAGAFSIPGLGGVPQAGAADPRVLLVVASDFQCPYCAGEEGVVRDVMGSHGRIVRLAFLQYPLRFHSRARPAATAAVAAGRQGRFWEYAASLFAGQDRLGEDGLIERARAMGLDEVRFATDRLAAAERIEKDRVLADLGGVEGTPAFLINGRRIGGAVPWDTLARAIDEEAAKVESDLESGLALAQSLHRRIAENASTRLADALFPRAPTPREDAVPPGL